MVGSLSTWTPVHAVDGWLFVSISSLVFYGATAYQKRRAAAARRELETSNQQLQVLSRVFRHNVRNDLSMSFRGTQTYSPSGSTTNGAGNA